MNAPTPAPHAMPGTSMRKVHPPPSGFATLYAVWQDGEPIGFVASEQVRPIVPRGHGGSMRSGKSPVTRWHAAEQVSDLGTEGAITSDVRYDAVEQLVDERKRRG